jgi:CheY-like chemotaxis protein
MRILYVEDNETNQALVERVVRARQHEIIVRDDGEGALEILAEDSSIDLVLLDIELAGSLSGIAVSKTLRERGDKRPVVAITAYAMMGDRERILAAGCDQYLPKPLAIADLLALFDQYANAGADRQAEAPAAAPPETVKVDAPSAPVLVSAPAAAVTVLAAAAEKPADHAPPAGEVRI